jgi:hypothetical protein
MAALAPVGAALSVGQQIGRYFALISMLPALLLVLWIQILITSGAPSGRPALHNVEYALSHWSVGKVTGVIIASLAVALLLHPLQFATTQLLEGYWGASSLAAAAMEKRIVHHRRQRRDLEEIATKNRKMRTEQALQILRGQPWWNDNPETRDIALDSVLQGESGDDLIRHYIAEQEALDRSDSKYPADAARILPTELGNVLRHFEDAAGKQYGLRALAIAPHLHLIVPPRHLEYLIDAREDMDSAIRICTIGLIAALLAICFLFTDGLWLLWTILPYSVSYLAYKGAVSAAQGYGSVVGAVIDLDRFLLYDELGVRQPRDSEEERESNRLLMRLLGGDQATVAYRRRVSAGEVPAAPAPRKRQTKVN